jgi:hypothetical protein
MLIFVLLRLYSVLYINKFKILMDKLNLLEVYFISKKALQGQLLQLQISLPNVIQQLKVQFFTSTQELY